MPWNHVYDFAFEVETELEDPYEVPAPVLRRALLARAMQLDDGELKEICNCFDSMDQPGNADNLSEGSVTDFEAAFDAVEIEYNMGWDMESQKYLLAQFLQEEMPWAAERYMEFLDRIAKEQTGE